MIWLADNAGTILTFIGGIIIAALGLWAAYLAYKANKKKAAVDQDLNAGTMALDLAKTLRGELTTVQSEMTKVKDEAASAKTEATEAHKQASLAQGALHQTRIWYLTEHLPWDRALMAIAEKADPVAFKALPRPQDPPLWPTDLAI